MLLLTPKDHFGLLSFAEGVELMRAGYEEEASAPVKLSNPRTRTNTPEGFRMVVHQGVTPSRDGAATGIRAEKVQIQENGIQKYIGRGRPVFVVYDTNTAELLMIMIGEPKPQGYEDVHAMAGFQTACCAAYGTSLVASPNARKVGILGSGGQARLHLGALASSRDIDSVVVYSPNKDHRENFASEMGRLLGLQIAAVDNTEAVIENSDLLLVCTNSNVPVLDGKQLKDGTHVTSIVSSNKELLQAGLVKKMRQEVDDETLRRAGLIVTTSKEQEELDQPEVLWGAAQRGVFSWDKVASVADVLSNRKLLSETHQNKEITFFKNAGGWGIGAGAFFHGYYDKAREAGVGTVLDGLEGFEVTYGF